MILLQFSILFDRAGRKGKSASEILMIIIEGGKDRNVSSSFTEIGKDLTSLEMAQMSRKLLIQSRDLFSLTLRSNFLCFFLFFCICSSQQFIDQQNQHLSVTKITRTLRKRTYVFVTFIQRETIRCEGGEESGGIKKIQPLKGNSKIQILLVIVIVSFITMEDIVIEGEID